MGVWKTERYRQRYKERKVQRASQHEEPGKGRLGECKVTERATRGDRERKKEQHREEWGHAKPQVDAAWAQAFPLTL